LSYPARNVRPMDGQLGEAVELLAAATRQLLEADRTRPSSRELLDELTAVEVVRRQLEAVSHAQVAELEDRKIAAEQARTSTADLLVQLLRLSPAEARLRVARAADLGPRRGLQGQPLEPIYPRLADAQRAGSVSPAQVSLIIKTLDAVPAEVSHEAVPVAEQFLIEHAHHLNPKPLGILAARLLASIDPDGAEPRDEEFQRRRGFTLRTQPDGSSLPMGYLTPDCTAALQAVLDPLSRPVPSADGIGDDRSPTQRRHDALLELSQRILRSGDLPDCGGVPATIILTLTDHDFRTHGGVASTRHGTPIAVAAALTLADQAEIYAVQISSTGAILDYGRCRRLATASQRRALTARDHGCAFPGCTVPASWCQVDHVVPWYLGGPTNLNNLQLLCGFHHRTYAKRGWRARMRDGVPEWLPPAWLDPDQKPVRNTAHHLPDFEFS
jgi:hypothetical protein